MRELNSGGHKLRRPSFSNTLSELPEVEEPDNAVETLGHLPDGTASSFKVLPPINGDEIHPSPRPRFNTIPEGVTERPKYIKTRKVGTIDAKQDPDKERLSQSSPCKALHLQKLESKLACPHTVKKLKRRKISDVTSRRASFSSEKKETDSSRSRNSTIPPIQRCREASVSALPEKGRINKNGFRVSNSSISSTESFHKSENIMYDKEMSDKKVEVIKWRKALDRAKTESPNGSFENLAQSFVSDGYLNRNRRRYSMPLDCLWDRRMSNLAFAGTRRKVDILLKYGKALRNRYHNIPTDNRSPPSKTIRTLADFMVEMPKKPRFSSFMSPEAQYSLMKGYEDKLYRKLSKSLPDHNPLLKRNKTPKNISVDIKAKNTLGFLDDAGDEDDDDDEQTENGEFGSELEKGGSSFMTQLEDNLSPSVIQDSLSINSEHQDYEDAKKVLRSLRRLSISLEKNGRDSVNRQFLGDYDDDGDEDDICSTFTPRQRSHSMPSMSSLPFQRRLMMSYRLQSAMDILDNMKCGEDTYLSPRLRVKRGANLTEYNTWVSEWNNEFCLRNCHL